MAINGSGTAFAFMEFPLSISRQDAFPLDRSTVFYTEEELTTYATSSPLAYVGQPLALITDGVAKFGTIKNTAGDIMWYEDSSDVADLVSSTYVHKTGSLSESITGAKTFTNTVSATAGSITSVDDVTNLGISVGSSTDGVHTVLSQDQIQARNYDSTSKTYSASKLTLQPYGGDLQLGSAGTTNVVISGSNITESGTNVNTYATNITNSATNTTFSGSVVEFKNTSKVEVTSDVSTVILSPSSHTSFTTDAYLRSGEISSLSQTSGYGARIGSASATNLVVDQNGLVARTWDNTSSAYTAGTLYLQKLGGSVSVGTADQSVTNLTTYANVATFSNTSTTLTGTFAKVDVTNIQIDGNAQFNSGTFSIDSTVTSVTVNPISGTLFRSTVKATTVSANDSSTNVATTEYVDRAVKTADDTAVHLAGDETITGTKTFSSVIYAQSGEFSSLTQTSAFGVQVGATTDNNVVISQDGIYARDYDSTSSSSTPSTLNIQTVGSGNVKIGGDTNDTNVNSFTVNATNTNISGTNLTINENSATVNAGSAFNLSALNTTVSATSSFALTTSNGTVNANSMTVSGSSLTVTEANATISATSAVTVSATSSFALTTSNGTVNANSMTVSGSSLTVSETNATVNVASTASISATTLNANTANTTISATSGITEQASTIVLSATDSMTITASSGTTFTTPVYAPTVTDALTSSTQVATTAFVQSAVNEKIKAADAMIYKGTLGSSGATISELPFTSALTGWTYKCSVAGDYVTNYNGSTAVTETLEIGDMIICLTGADSSTKATWNVIQNNVTKEVSQVSASVTSGHFAVYDDTTGNNVGEYKATVGGQTSNTINPVWVNSGFITSFTSSVGDNGKPVFINGGTITSCSSEFVHTNDNQTITGQKTFATSGGTQPIINNTGNSSEALTIKRTDFSTTSNLSIDFVDNTSDIANVTATKATASSTEATITAIENTNGTSASIVLHTESGNIYATAPTYSNSYTDSSNKIATTSWVQNAVSTSPYGTCTTSGSTAAKTVTVNNFALTSGAKVIVTFSNTNSAASATLNVNSTGAKAIKYRGVNLPTNYVLSGKTYEFVYDGTSYNIVDAVATPESIGIGYGTCSTVASTTEKAVTFANYDLFTNGYVTVKFTNDVQAGATLNVNSRGAKPIFAQGSAITSNTILAGDTATFVFDGTNYNLISVDNTGEINQIKQNQTIAASNGNSYYVEKASSDSFDTALSTYNTDNPGITYAVNDVMVVRDTDTGKQSAYTYNGTSWVACTGTVDASKVIMYDNIKMAGNYTQVGNQTKTSAGISTFETKGMSVYDVFEAIFTKRIQPTAIILPYITSRTFNNSSVEAGTKITSISVPAASLYTGSYTYGPYVSGTIDSSTGIGTRTTGVGVTSWTLTRVLNTTSSTAVTSSSTTFSAYSDTNGGSGFVIGDAGGTAVYSSLKYVLSCTFTSGSVALDNLGDASSPTVQITSKTISTESATTNYNTSGYSGSGYNLTAPGAASVTNVSGLRTCYRNYFYGGTSTTDSISTLISAGYSYLASSAQTSANYDKGIRSLSKSNAAYSAKNFSFTIPAGTKLVAIACISGKTGVTKVINNTALNADVTDVFTKTSGNVNGASGYTASAYNIWYYAPKVAYENATTFTVTLA